MNKIIRYIKNGELLYKIKVHFFRTKKWFKIYDVISCHHNINNKKIVFSNMSGHGYGGDPKYIADYIIKNNLDYELIWLVNSKLGINKSDFPKKIKIVEMYSFKALYEMSTAFIWIDNARKMIYPAKKNEQIYIQTWHGTYPSKKIEKDAENTLDPFYVNAAKKDSQMIDYIISGCEFKSKIYRESFYYNGPVLNIGTPKIDLFFDKKRIEEYSEKVKKYYNISKNDYVVMYAPTFRKDMNISVYNLDYKRVADAFEKKMKRKCTLLVRLHPNLTMYSDSLELPENIINATKYPDMQELICVSDAIISDYSSTADYSIFDRPIFLYCPDLDDYMKNDRDFYIGISQQPFEMAQTNDEIVENIMQFDKEKYLKSLHCFYDKYGLCEKGTSCESIIELIKNKQEELL